MFCSFCLREDVDVNKLIDGPGVCICDECIGLCVTILDDDRKLHGDEPTPHVADFHGLSDEVMLSRIGKMTIVSAQVEGALQHWVAELRRRGIAWARIGEALQMTRQSAWTRFADKP